MNCYLKSAKNIFYHFIILAQNVLHLRNWSDDKVPVSAFKLSLINKYLIQVLCKASLLVLLGVPLARFSSPSSGLLVDRKSPEASWILPGSPWSFSFSPLPQKAHPCGCCIYPKAWFSLLCFSLRFAYAVWPRLDLSPHMLLGLFCRPFPFLFTEPWENLKC